MIESINWGEKNLQVFFTVDKIVYVQKKIPASQNKMYIPAYTWRLGENQRPRIVHDLNVKCSTHVLFLGPQLAVIFWKTVETSVNYRSGSLGWAPQGILSDFPVSIPVFYPT